MSEALEDVLQRIPQGGDSPYVFHQESDRLRRFGWVRTDFQKAIAVAGLKGTRMHDLRHTAATQLRRLGCDLSVVQRKRLTNPGEDQAWDADQRAGVSWATSASLRRFMPGSTSMR